MMLMLPYPPPYAQSKTEENQVLRSLGAILALLGIIFHQGGFELIFALLIVIFSLRTFILWLGDTQRNQQREPFTPPQTRNSQPLSGSYQPYPPQPGYFASQQRQPTFYPAATNEMTVPFAPVAPGTSFTTQVSGAPFAPTNSQSLVPAQAPLPPAVLPQPQSGFFSNQVQAVPQGSFVPPTQSFVTALPAPMPPAAMPQPAQAPATAAWAPSAYAPGPLMLPAPAAPPTTPAAPPAFPPPEQPAAPGRWGQGRRLPQQESGQQ